MASLDVQECLARLGNDEQHVKGDWPWTLELTEKALWWLQGLDWWQGLGLQVPPLDNLSVIASSLGRVTRYMAVVSQRTRY